MGVDLRRILAPKNLKSRNPPTNALVNALRLQCRQIELGLGDIPKKLKGLAV